MLFLAFGASNNGRDGRFSGSFPLRSLYDQTSRPSSEQIAHQMVRPRYKDLSHRIYIEDGEQAVLATVPFRTVVKIVDFAA